MSGGQTRLVVIVTGAVVMISSAATIATVSAAERTDDSRRAAEHQRLKLPVGSVVPAISMGATHGLILASDGSLWSWGANGWPVLGLGHIKTQAVLHRIGNESQWAGISSS